MQEKYSIGIIGGNGKMGKFFLNIFQKYGIKTSSWGRKNKKQLKHFVMEHDIIILSVPIDKTVEMIEKISPFLSKDQCITDFTSLKKQPMQAMAKTPAKYFGMHPMFAPPLSGKLEGQKIIFCKATGENEQQFLEEIFTEENAQLQHLSAEKHDSLMSLVQGLSHFLDITFVKTLEKSGFCAEEIFSSRSPAYALKMMLAGRTFSQDGNLYGNIQIQNDENKKTISNFLDISKEVFSLIEEKNLEGFEKIFNEEKKFFGIYAEKSKNESDLLIDFLAHRILGKKHQKTEKKIGGISKNFKRNTKIGILGPEKTFSHIAAQKFFPQNANLVLFPSIPSIFSAYIKGEISEIFVPIENILHGMVGETVDGIITTKIPIQKVFEMKISPSLFTALGTRKEDITEILSHPQALAQCSNFLDENFPNANFVPTHSTGHALEKVIRSATSAAIAAPEIIDSYELIPLYECIANQGNNATRFVHLSEKNYSIADDQTPNGALIFSLKTDAPGGLEHILHEFSNRDINLTKIESRPTGRLFGEYIFFVSYEGRISEGEKEKLLSAVSEKITMIQFLGEYSICSEMN